MSFTTATAGATATATSPAAPKYNEQLSAPIVASAAAAPQAPAHELEWRRVLDGTPVEINPSVGQGYRVMTVAEWAARWKRNDDFPECLACGGADTKEHYFTQTWCRGKKTWDSETLCLACHAFSRRQYRDPDFKTPEQYEKEQWSALVPPRSHPAA